MGSDEYTLWNLIESEIGGMTMQKKFRVGQMGMVITLSVLVFTFLVVTAPKIGLTWDEPDYIAAAKSYMGWYGQLFTQPGSALHEDAITHAWSVNKEHPPLDKVWSGMFWVFTRNLTDDLTAHRIGNMLLVAILAGLLYTFIVENYGRVAGLASVAALITMPRFFFHSHLAALDVPAAFSIFVVTFVFWKTLERKGQACDVLLGLVWGLALATKINALFIPFTLGAWWLVVRRDAKTFWRFVVMGLVGIPVSFVVWPWLYVNTGAHLWEYILFMTVDHWEIGQYYFGQFFMPPPWHFGFVMTWAALPLGLTALYITGMVRIWKPHRDEGLGLLLILSALTPILAIAIGQSMVYDNERLIMVAFPFLAALAGIGFNWILSCWNKLSERWGRPFVSQIGAVGLVVLAFVPQSVAMVRMYPHLLSYYGEGVGGLKGATSLGLENTYWCESYQLALPVLNEKAEPGDLVWVDPWSHNVMLYYQMLGRLRDDLVFLAPMDVPSVLGEDGPRGQVHPIWEADWFVFQHRQTMFGFAGEKGEIYRELGNREVVYEYSIDGVPILTVLE
jgi:4-amino-4-deoxy-L-arabinose transferase-like glycosyltransferase